MSTLTVMAALIDLIFVDRNDGSPAPMHDIDVELLYSICFIFIQHNTEAPPSRSRKVAETLC